MNKRSELTGNHGYADDYTLYETQPQTHTSKGDAIMKNLHQALDTVLQDTNANTLNDTTLFYTNGDVFTGTQAEVQAALTETTRDQVQAVLTHGADALYATIDGWYNVLVDHEILGEIGSWEEFKTLLPDEYEQDLQEIHAYLKSQEVASNLDTFYEKLIVEDDEEKAGC